MLERHLPHQHQRQRQKQKQSAVPESKPPVSDVEKQQQHASSSLSSPPQGTSSSTGSGDGGNVDRVLFNNLVEMVPLVETLMDRRVNSSFTRRASMIYTPTPSQPKKSVDPKSRKAYVFAKKQRQVGDDTSDRHIAGDNLDNGGRDLLVSSAKALPTENDKQELNSLREQLDDLHKKLLEKDEILKFAESSLKSANGTIEELKQKTAEKDLLAKSAHTHLNNTKIKLADKQAALEKLGWEAMEANSKIEKLQGNLDSVDFEMSIFTKFFEEVSKSSPAAVLDEDITYFNNFCDLPNLDVDDNAVEEARLAYEAAVASAKENPSDETLAFASEARNKLRSFVV